MSAKDNGGPAFPVTDPNNINPMTLSEYDQAAHGMSIRAYISAKILMAMASDPMVLDCFRKNAKKTAETVARDAVVFADALISELDRAK